ncbi:Tn3 family transposase, partial [Escherichia coli]|uniref:Tn3 family transposase n=1 Tax=Escherichia coli TaxID=562 RepID=UPI0021B1F3C3
GPQNDVTLKMPAFEWVHVQLHQQKGMISLSPPTICNSAILDWLQSVELRRRVHAGLNKGEARNALARAVFFYRLGEIRDRSFEQQRYRASGLNLVTAAIVLWNTVYLERATSALRGNGTALDDTLLQYLSPLGWEHINLTGDYLWRSSAKVGAGKFRPLRPLPPA